MTEINVKKVTFHDLSSPQKKVLEGAAYGDDECIQRLREVTEPCPQDRFMKVRQEKDGFTLKGEQKYRYVASCIAPKEYEADFLKRVVEIVDRKDLINGPASITHTYHDGGAWWAVIKPRSTAAAKKRDPVTAEKKLTALVQNKSMEEMLAMFKEVKG